MDVSDFNLTYLTLSLYAFIAGTLASGEIYELLAYEMKKDEGDMLFPQ